MEGLFCYNPEPVFKLENRYKPPFGSDFVCSQCVQMFLAADEEDLNSAFNAAIDRGEIREAAAIKFFLIPEEIKKIGTRFFE
jgi:hypothetical protein